MASYQADLRYFLCSPTLLHLLGHMSQPLKCHYEMNLATLVAAEVLFHINPLKLMTTFHERVFDQDMKCPCKAEAECGSYLVS